MTNVITAARYAARRFVGSWQTDVADPVEMARLRARIIVATCLLGAVTTATSALSQVGTDGASHAMIVALPIGTFLVVFALAVALKGPTAGDWFLVVLLSTGYVFGALGVASSDGTGQVAKTALAYVIDTVFGAVFLERRRTLVGQLAFAIGLLAVVAGQAPARTHPFTDLGSATVGLLIMALTVRLLRDLAISAVLQARRGEVTDPLTGLANRRGLERFGTQHWQRSAEAGLHVAALVIDIDHFKHVNDTQGHAAGDQILQRLGDLLPTMLRAGDVAVRLGGEEFLVLCTVPPGTADLVAERIRDTVERELRPVTVSIGVHETLPTEADTVPEAIWSAVDTADQALYIAKAAGRNRVFSA
jgi:diguanylate cyclase (GGDEF)-like protein